MRMRRAAQLLAMFGLYALVIGRILSSANGKHTTDYTTGLIELAVATVVFGLAVVYVMTRRPRARPPIE